MLLNTLGQLQPWLRLSGWVAAKAPQLPARYELYVDGGLLTAVRGRGRGVNALAAVDSADGAGRVVVLRTRAVALGVELP